jgi:nitroreductase
MINSNDDKSGTNGYPERLAPVNHLINELAKRRWSPRAFDESKQVEREKILSLLEAARWAPSCFNEQPWRYLVFDGSDAEALKRARGCLIGFNVWATKAPVLLLSIARESFINNSRPNRHAQHDLGLASGSLVLEAVNQGLIAHQMGGFDAEKARREFGIPAGHTPMAMIAIGYPRVNGLDDLPRDLKAAELQPRTRKPIGQVAFYGKWESPYPES